MLDYIWAFMTAGGIIFSLLTGHGGDISSSVVQGADKAVQLIISIAGSMCLWTGIMNIADKSGLSDKISHVLKPFLGMLIPVLKEDEKASGAVCANVTANLLGLGNAATPLGIKAMHELKKHNPSKDSPDNSMIMFVVINTASIQIIPTTAAALRQAAGSTQPYSILPAVWISSVIALTAGITAAKFSEKTAVIKNSFSLNKRLSSQHSRRSV